MMCENCSLLSSVGRRKKVHVLHRTVITTAPSGCINLVTARLSCEDFYIITEVIVKYSYIALFYCFSSIFKAIPCSSSVPSTQCVRPGPRPH